MSHFSVSDWYQKMAPETDKCDIGLRWIAAGESRPNGLFRIKLIHAVSSDHIEMVKFGLRVNGGVRAG
jgi:hypothetical protein